MARRVIKGRQTSHRLKGGPFDGQTVGLYSPGTLTFSCRGFTGRYDNQGVWVEINGKNT